MTCATVSGYQPKSIAGNTRRASPTLTHHTCTTATRLTSANRMYSEADPAIVREKHEVLVEQVGDGHAAEIGDDDRELIWDEPVDDDATDDIDDRCRPACEQEPDEAPKIGAKRHGTRSAIILPKRTLSEMPRSSG